LRDAGPARIAHLISDALVDDYFPILDEVDSFVDVVEHCDLLECDKVSFEKILQVRRLAFGARRGLRPHREVFESLAHGEHRLIPYDAKLYFRDVWDHVMRITDSLDAYHDLISNSVDAYVAQVSMRINYASRVFSAIATIALPFIIISGLYGMNVAHIPLAQRPSAFWLIVVLQAAISLVLLMILRRRGVL
jgi:magnesium transporter